jgi:lysophospholipase L1-like esterase
LFCQLVVNNVDFALEHGLRVIVASQPYFVPPDYERLHQEQQDRMATMVTAKYRHRPGVRYVDLRTKIDMSDRQLSFDRMHLTGRGNAIVAHALAEPVADLLRD